MAMRALLVLLYPLLLGTHTGPASNHQNLCTPSPEAWLLKQKNSKVCPLCLWILFHKGFKIPFWLLIPGGAKISACEFRRDKAFIWHPTSSILRTHMCACLWNVTMVRPPQKRWPMFHRHRNYWPSMFLQSQMLGWLIKLNYLRLS